MEKSQSLTPEVVAILSEIREQAHKYNQAFETFQTLVSEAEALQKHSDDYFERLESKTLRLAEEFQKTSEESVAKVNAKLTSIDHIFHELETIQAVKASLQTLEDTFKKNTSSLAGVVENIKTLVIRQVEKETARLDRKINVLNEEHTEHFAVIGQAVEEIKDQHRRSFIMLDEEIGLFKSKVQETKYIVDETVRLSNMLVENAEKDIAERFCKAEENMTVILKNLESSAKSTEDRVIRLIREADVANLSMKVVSVSEQIKDSQARIGTAFWVAMISLFVNICLIVAFLIMKL
ncbi:hypothetical protein MASR2M18_02980 [Ignavibacteria bacterium]|nr:hypothetical protein [Bacteroidota bacterium]MCZ2133376.1 hypothetical protein [Bacteroidota bacterium]